MQNNLIIATAVFSALAFSAPSANAVSLKYPFGKNKILPGYKPFIKPFHNNNLDVTIEKLLGSHPWKTLGYTAINAPASRLKKSCRGAKSKCLSV